MIKKQLSLNQAKFNANKNFYLLYQLFFMVQLASSQFNNYEEAILSSDVQIMDEKINMINSEGKDTYGIGFWSMSIPVKIPKTDLDFDIPFHTDELEDGELLLLVKDSDTNTNLILVYKIIDYPKLQVCHQIKFLLTNQNFYYNFNGLEYEGVWMFHLILIQPIQGLVIVEISRSSKYSTKFPFQLQQNLNIILGGRGYINDLNLNSFKGLLSKLVFVPIFSFEEFIFELILINNLIPPKYSKEQQVYIVPKYFSFDGHYAQQNFIDQYGDRYCLSGWVKYNFANSDEGRYTLLRMTSSQFYEDQKKLGDELFSLGVFYSKINPEKTKVIVHADAYSMPISQSFQSQYDLTFQGVQNKEYQVVESTKIFENTVDFRYYEGLSQWHFIQYEYGRSNFDEKMLFQVQFNNQLGLIKEQLGNNIFRGSFINSRFYIFFGGDNFNSNLLQGEVYDFQIQYYYADDKKLTLICHYSCLICKGPLINDCLMCDEISNRYFQNELYMCKCFQGYFDFGNGICTTEFYSSVSEYELENQLKNFCPFGFFRLPIDEINYQCKQCPLSMTLSIILCADCYFYYKTWYLTPVCKLDLLTIKETQDQTFRQVARDPIDYDLYTIGLEGELMLHSEFEDYCTKILVNYWACLESQFYHLGRFANMKCKSNYYIDISDLNCHKFKQICQGYNSYGYCSICIPGQYLDDILCVDCPIECVTCEKNIYDELICKSCSKYYNLLNGQCQTCGEYCEICDVYSYDNHGKQYLRCSKCINESKYFLSLDGKNCLINDIYNCVHAFQALQDDMTINSFDINYQPQFDQSQIITLCARCEDSYFFVFETKQCVQDIKNQDCQFGIGKLNQNDQSLESILCLSSSQQFDQVVEFTENCFSYNSDCNICLETDLHGYYSCLDCLNGYYSAIPSGKCSICPPDLKCKSCYSQHSVLKDRWKVKVRAFYRKYIEINNFHQFTKYGQSQNSSDYEIICSSCIQGYRLHNNKCIEYCPEACVECVFQNDQYICSKCQQEQRGRQLTLINNQCLECPENCALCRVRTNEEIQLINPVFNNLKYQKYTYQCLKSYEDRNYYYDDDFGLFVECKHIDQGNGCEKQLIISLNLYFTLNGYIDDYSLLQDMESKIKFRRENIDINSLASFTTSFVEYENDEFYTLANSKFIKSIIIKISSKKNPRGYIYGGGYIKQIFSENIFTLKYLFNKQNRNVEIEFKFQEEVVLFPQSDVYFINFSKITLNKIVLFVTQTSKFIFNSYIPQTIIIKDVRLQLDDQTNIHEINFEFSFHNVNSLLVNNLFLSDISLIYTGNFIRVEETPFPKSLIFKNITINQCNIQKTFLSLGLGDQDIVQIDIVKVMLNFSNSAFILVSQKNESGLIQLSNVELTGNLQDSIYFFNFQQVFKLEIINFSVRNTILDNVTFIILNRNSYLENIRFQDNQFLQKSFGIVNSNDFSVLNINQTFVNLLFQDNQYDTLIKFISLKKYSSQSQNIKLSTFSQINNYYMKDQLNDYRNQLDFTLITIQYDYIEISNFVIDRGLGLNDISLSDSLEIKIQNGTIIQQKYRFLGLHKYQSCQLNQVVTQLYSTTINIGSSKQTELKNLTFSKILSYNFPIIAIDSVDKKLNTQNESILLQDISFSSSLILYTENIFETSLISISSSQKTSIQIINIKFRNNVLHHYNQFDITRTAGLLLFNCQFCTITLRKSLFQNNLVLNSQKSIIYIKSQKLEITNCTFQNNSVFMYEVLQPHILWGFTSPVSLQVIREIFQSNPKSGIGEFYAENILIQDNTFINSSGSIGGCFSIFSYGNTDILISDNRFEGIYSPFLNQVENGGVIYIDGSQSLQIKVDIRNNTCYKIFCRGLGGFIYFKSNTSQSNLTITNLQLEDVYSQSGSAIYVSYSKFVKQPQILSVQKLLVINTQIGYLEFLNKFTELSNQQEIKQLINYRTQIYLEFGSLTQISDVKINNLILESFLILYETISVYLSYIQVQNSSISNNLISITSQTTFNKKLTFENSLFLNIKIGFDFSNLINQNCIHYNPSLDNNIYYCLNSYTSAPLILDDSQQQGGQLYNGICVYQEIVQYLDQSDSGLILFHNFTNEDTIQIISISFFNIFCSICQNGLIQIYFQSSTYNSQQQLIASLSVRNSTCGKQGCLNLEKQTNQIRRLLSEFELFSLNYDLEIRNYVCQYNIATQGTCLKLTSLETLIQNSLFQFNQATQEGGSIYVRGKKHLIIYNSIIQLNKASIGGGLYFQDSVAMNQSESKSRIVKNSAERYGNNIASIPQQLSIQIKSDSRMLQTITKVNNSTLKIQEVVVSPYIGINGKTVKFIYLPTGQKISQYEIFDWKNKFYYKSNLIFRVFALDGDMNSISNLEDSFCTITSRIFNITKGEDQEFTNNYTNMHQVNFDIQTQSYNLDDMIIYFDNSAPLEIVLQLQFTCNLIKVPIYSNSFPYELSAYNSNYNLRINLKTLNCQIGEIKNFTSLSCEKCDSNKGLYSLTLNAERCEIKDDLTTINIQDNQLLLRAGYWRPYFDTKAISFCLNLQVNCLGGIFEGDSSCYIGHIGALCEQCDLYNTRGQGQYSIVKRFACGLCVNRERNILLILGIIIITLFFLLIQVQGNIKTIEQCTKYLPFKNLRNSIFMNRNQAGTLIKMLTNYFQIVVSITTFQLQFSEGLNNTLNAVGNPLQTSSYSLDCFLVDLRELQIEYARIIWQITLPVLYVSIFISCYFLATKIRKNNFNPSVGTTALIYIYIYFQPNLINGLIELMSYRIISGFRWIQANVSQRYDTNSHKQWMLEFCLPFIILISIIIPCYFFFGLYSNKNNLERRRVRLNWGYLYNEYKLQAYFWELIKIIQKELIILSIVYYEDTIVAKGVLVLFITYVYQELNANYQPYKLNKLNKLDYYSANICMITIGLAIGAYISQQVHLDELQILFFCTMGLLNFLFLSNILAKIINEQFKDYNYLLDAVTDKIKLRFPKADQYQCTRRLLKNRVEEKRRVLQAFQKLKHFGIQIAKHNIKMRQMSQDQIISKIRIKSHIDNLYVQKQDGLEFEKSSQNRMVG